MSGTVYYAGKQIGGVDMQIDKNRGSGAEPTEGRLMYVAVPTSPPVGASLPELWGAVWAGKWFIIATAGICAVASIFYALSVTPVFRAEVVIAPASHDQGGSSLGGLGGIASLAGIRLDNDASDGQALAIFKSRDFIARFIDEKKLLPVLFSEEWDEVSNSWINSSPDNMRDIRDGVKLFNEDVRSVSQDAETGLVTLAIEWTDAELAAAWAKELVDRINARMRKRDIEDSQRKLDYLDDQLQQASLVELRQAIARVIEEQISAMMLAQSQAEYAFTVIDPAVAPKERIRPKRTLIVVTATFFGGFLAVFVLFVRVGLRSKTFNGRDN